MNMTANHRTDTATAVATPTVDPAILADRLALPLAAVKSMTSRYPALMQALIDAAEDAEAGIDVEKLPERDRRWLWRTLRRHDPSYAQLLRDPGFAAFRAATHEHFNARLVLEWEHALSVLRSAFSANISEQRKVNG